MTSSKSTFEDKQLQDKQKKSQVFQSALKLHTRIAEVLKQHQQEGETEAFKTAKTILEELDTAMKKWITTTKSNSLTNTNVLMNEIQRKSKDKPQDPDLALLNACKTSLYTHARKLLHATDFISQICAAINEFMTDCGLRPIFTIKKSEIALSDETIEQEIAALRSPRA